MGEPPRLLRPGNGGNSLIRRVCCALSSGREHKGRQLTDAVVVEGDAAEQAVTPATESAHAAAVAEGMTAVQADQAAESAEKAEAAAAVALEAAAANAAVAEAVIEAEAKAETSAEAAEVTAEMLMEALQAQTASIAALTEELHASRKAAQPPAEKKAPAAETAPGEGNGRTWTRR